MQMCEKTDQKIPHSYAFPKLWNLETLTDTELYSSPIYMASHRPMSETYEPFKNEIAIIAIVAS